MSELAHFRELKKTLLVKFCETQPHWDKGLVDFGQREIRHFQNILQEKTGGRVSEKWFYTHLKKDHPKLPRVDVLDLLSQFVGYQNWSNFQSKNAVTYSSIKEEQIKTTKKNLPEKENKKRSGVLVLLLTGGLAFFTLVLVLSNINSPEVSKYEICFMDALTRLPIKNAGLTIKQLPKNESPKTTVLTNNNCHVFSIKNKEVIFSVEADYYHTDTIRRSVIDGQKKETILLRRDEYAWMIHLFSSGNLKDIEKQRIQLGKMISDEAMIFQIDAATGMGMELYNKKEFIRKMTLPVLSLKNIRVLNTLYDKNGQILKMKFIQEE